MISQTSQTSQPFTPPHIPSVHPALVTTAFDLPGYRLVRNLGVVRGIVVRSRNIFATVGAGLMTVIGGDITPLTQLCESSRQDSFAMMSLHAAQLGANAIIGARYDANELMSGVTEVLAYGTAVVVEPVSPPPEAGGLPWHASPASAASSSAPLIPKP